MQPHSSRLISAAQTCVLGAALLLAGTRAASASTWNWGALSGTWDDSTTANWNPASVPSAVTNSLDFVNLTTATVANVDITYTATAGTRTPTTAGTEYGQLTIGNTGGGTTTLYLDGTDLLPVAANPVINTGGVLHVSGGTFTPNYTVTLNSGGQIIQSGGWIEPAYSIVVNGGTYTVSSGTSRMRELTMAPASGTATFHLSGGNVISHGGETWWKMGTGDGTAVFNQTGGNFSNSTTSAGHMLIGRNATYNLSAGSATFNGLEVGGGTVHQTGGTNTATGVGLSLGGVRNGGGLTGTYQLDGGLLTATKLSIGCIDYGSGPAGTDSSGVMIQNGGTVSVGIVQMSLPNAAKASSYTIRGGALQGPAGAGVPVTINPMATFQGYSTAITGTAKTLANAGRVIADGNGVARTLDLSSFATVSNPIENTAAHGWYAQNQGKLVLPNLTLSTLSTINWGESATDSTPDLVNSARITFAGPKTGTLSGSLLATDHADVAELPPVGYGFISVHEFASAGFAIGSFNLGIRYDDAAVRDDLEPLLALFQWNGSAWTNMTSNVDTLNKIIYANNLTSFGQFAIGMVPEPSMVLLFGLGGWLLLWARRRKQ